LEVSQAQREVLEKVARSATAAHREVVRARVLLDAADGVANVVIAQRHEVTAVTVRAWRKAFEADGLTKWGTVAKGRGRKPTVSDEKVAEIVELTTKTRPKGQTHWSTRTMAERAGVSKDTVRRIWHDLGLKPHRVETFKVSNDPRFTEKLIDVVGLYLNPPTKAVVLCMDEKSSIQALDRTQASLREVPWGLQIHLILDNYATHKHADVEKWLKRHKRFHLHFTPTSSSWLNQVERWFRDLTEKNLRRGIFGSVPDLIASIETYLEANNDDPKPYVWTATAEDILAKVAGARAALDQVVS